MRRISMTATMAAVLSLAAAPPVPALAQGPATLRGQVYLCDSRAPVAGAPVAVTNLEDGTQFNLLADAHGRFVRVGLAPGTYLIAATVPLPRYRFAASRVARLETDDVVDAQIGVWDRLGTPGGCEPYRVPLAIPTSSRYIIH